MDEFVAKVLTHIFDQGLTVSLLALALYYLHSKLNKLEVKISECEQDRLKLWERIAQLHD
jgi:hypothetical protein